jgi:hypothetical protein
VSQQHAPDEHAKHLSLTSLQGRQKRKNEQLAQDIFGKNRRQSAPAAGNTKKGPIGGSLASRVGVTKVCLAYQHYSSRPTPLTTSTAHSIDPSLEWRDTSQWPWPHQAAAPKQQQPPRCQHTFETRT